MTSSKLKQPLTPRARNLLVVLFLISLPPIFFWRATLGFVTLGDKDAVFWFFPAYKFVAEQIRSGSLPLWNPYQYSGAPMFAEWQAGALNPINWIHLIETTSRSLTLSLEIGFAIALLAMFSYARSIGLTRRAAIVSAVIYGLSGFLVARTIYPGFLHIVALAPFVLYFVEKLYQEDRWRYVAGGAFVVAWQVFAAHPQPLIYSSLLASAYALFCAFLRRGGPEASNLKPQTFFLAKFALMFIAGACLSAIQLLPAAEFASQSVRREWPFELFTLHSLHPLSLLTTLFPFFHGEGQGIYQMPYWGVYWHHNEAQIYLGVAALSLAIAGAASAWRARFNLGIFWSCVAVAGVTLALGKYSAPVARALYHVPVIGNFRSPNRHWMLVALAAAVLAGYAVDRLLREESGFVARATQIAALSLSALCVAVGGFVLWRRDVAEAFIRSLSDLGNLPQGFLQTAGAEFYLPMITAICAAIAIVIFARAKNRGRWFTPLLALLIIDYHLYAAFAPVTNPAKYESLVGTAIPKALAAKQSERDPIRYQVMLNPASGEFSPFWFYGAEMVTGYDPVLSERYKIFSGIDEAGRSFIPTLLDSQDHTLDLLNTRYVLLPPSYFDPPGSQKVARSDRAEQLDSRRWRESTEQSEAPPYREFRIFENLRLMPRVWLVERLRVAYEGDQLKLIRGELAGQNFDPRAEALVDHATAAFLHPSLTDSTEEANGKEPEAVKADILERGPTRMLVEAEARKPSILVLSEIVYPGWRVKVDGIESELLLVNYNLRGVALAPGKHRVELFYSPVSLKVGAVVSITTALCLLFVLLREKRRTKWIKVAGAV